MAGSRSIADVVAQSLGQLVDALDLDDHDRRGPAIAADPGVLIVDRAMPRGRRVERGAGLAGASAVGEADRGRARVRVGPRGAGSATFAPFRAVVPRDTRSDGAVRRRGHRSVRVLQRRADRGARGHRVAGRPRRLDAVGAATTDGSERERDRHEHDDEREDDPAEDQILVEHRGGGPPAVRQRCGEATIESGDVAGNQPMVPSTLSDARGAVLLLTPAIGTVVTHALRATWGAWPGGSARR